MDTTNKFRLSAVNLYLTYPKCDLDLNDVLSLLKDILINYVLKDYILVREYHEDNSSHIHAYLKCAKKFSTRDPNYLDLKTSDYTYHGNYQSAKKPNKVIQYILKDISHREDPNLIYSPSLNDRISELGIWLEFGEAIIKLAENGKVPAAMDLYKKERPLDFIKNKSRIEKSLQELHMSKLGFNMKFDYSKFIIPEELKTVIDAYNDNKTLVIIGKPGIGKTSWLTSWLKLNGKSPLVVNNRDAIRFFNPHKHSAIVFDDCNWQDIGREELIKLVDSEVATTHSIKHSSVIIANLEGGPIPKYIIGNGPHLLEDTSILNKPYSDPAVRRRIHIVVLKDSSTFISPPY